MRADGFAAAGTFTEVQPPRRLVFTWGWADPAAQHVLGEQTGTGSALPPASTRVEVTLHPDGNSGTEGAENLCHLGICVKDGAGSVTALVLVASHRSMVVR